MCATELRAVASALAHEALAGGAHKRHRLGKEHAHRIPKRERLLVGAALHVHLCQRRGRQLDGGVQCERRELLALRLLHRLCLLLGELAQTSEQILRIALERKTEATFHALKHREGSVVKVALVQERAGVGLPPKAAERDWPRMDPPNVLWFFGAFALEFAVYELIQTIPGNQSGLWILLTAVGFLVAFGAAARALLQRWWWVPGGLAAALAVGVFPAVAVGFLELIHVWPSEPFFRPFEEFSGYTFGVALTTAAVGFAAWWLTRFSFLLGVANGAIVVSAQLLTPCFGESPSGDHRAATALVIGAVLFVVGVFLDAFARRREAFWFHVLGLFSVAAGLVFFTVNAGGDPERGWIPMLIGGVLLLIAAGPVRRATWAVYGVLGLYSPVVHYLIKDLNERRWPFALLLLALASSIFALGMLLHRYGEAWAGRFVRRPPPALSP